MSAPAITDTPLAAQGWPIARLLHRVRRRLASRVQVGAACVAPSQDALIGRLVAEISRGNRWVAVGRIPRTTSRRAHDAAMVERCGAHYVRHASCYAVVADHPFTVSMRIVAVEVSECPVRVGDHWITAERRGGDWTGQARLDRRAALRMGANFLAVVG